MKTRQRTQPLAFSSTALLGGRSRSAPRCASTANRISAVCVMQTPSKKLAAPVNTGMRGTAAGAGLSGCSQRLPLPEHDAQLIFQPKRPAEATTLSTAAGAFGCKYCWAAGPKDQRMLKRLLTLLGLKKRQARNTHAAQPAPQFTEGVRAAYRERATVRQPRPPAPPTPAEP